jgi:hypothetical protein
MQAQINLIDLDMSLLTDPVMTVHDSYDGGVPDAIPSLHFDKAKVRPLTRPLAPDNIQTSWPISDRLSV